MRRISARLETTYLFCAKTYILAIQSASIHRGINVRRQMQSYNFRKKCLLNSFSNKYLGKVEKILKGSLDLIPSPSRSCEHLNFLLLFFRQNIAGRCQQTFYSTKFVNNALQCLAKKMKMKNSNVHNSLKVMGLNPDYLLKSSLLYYCCC